MNGVNVFRLFGELALNGVDEARNELNDLGTQGEETRNELAKSFQDMGTKAGELGRNLALGIAGAVTAVVGLVEGTRELRQDLGKLTASFEVAGHGADVGKETFKELYGILGEDDTAIEAANHLSQLYLTEEELSKWTDVLTGVYATFGDSLPLEGLAEAANETAKVGQVTGPLADALNWVTMHSVGWEAALSGNSKALKAFNKATKEGATQEEAFNEALATCSNERERAVLITNTLNTMYDDASAVYKETNAEIIKGNEAQAELNLKMAEMADKMQPLVNKGKELLINVLEKITPALEWVIDNINILAPIAIGFITTLFALNIASKVKGFIATLKILNATMKANPIGVVITIIGLLITAFVTLWNNCEGFRNFWINLFEKISEVVSTAVDTIVSWFNKIVDFVKNNWQNLLLFLVNPFAGAFKLLYDNCDGFKEFIDNFIQGIKDTLATIGEWINQNVIQPIIGFFQGLWAGIQAVWDGIVLGIQIFIGLIASIFDAALQIILLPFTFLWENLKEYVFIAWEWIKEKINSAINFISEIITNVFTAISDFFTMVWEGIKNIFIDAWNAIVEFVTPILEAIKETITNIFEGIKEFFIKIWNEILNIANTIKEKVTEIWNGIKQIALNIWEGIKNNIIQPIKDAYNNVKTTIGNMKDSAVNAFNNLKEKAASVFEKVKTAITKPIEKARDVVKGVVDKIKGFFKFNVDLPKIKLPKFSIKPAGWEMGDLLKGTIPKLGITWNAEGAIFKKPTIFDTRNGLQGAGEAGPEAIAPISKLMDYTRSAVDGSNAGLEQKLDVLISLLTNYLPEMVNKQVVLSTGELVGAMVKPMDAALGELAVRKARGY